MDPSLEAHIRLIASDEFAWLVPRADGVSQHPFFQSGPELRVPPSTEPRPACELLPDELSAVYRRYADDVEFAARDDGELARWTFLSEREIRRRHAELAAKGRGDLADVAVAYAGMGHVDVLVHDVAARTVRVVLLGGANSYDREANERRRLADRSQSGQPFAEWKARCAAR